MSFLEDVISDLSTFFEDQAIDALWNAVTYKVIFFNEYEAVALFGAEIESRNPHILVKESDFSGITHDSTITIGGVAYKVKSPQPDGTGVMLIELSKD